MRIIVRILISICSLNGFAQLDTSESIDVFIVAGGANAAGRGWITGGDTSQPSDFYMYDIDANSFQQASVSAISNYQTCIDNGGSVCPHYIGFNRFSISAKQTEIQGQNIAYGFGQELRAYYDHAGLSTKIGFIQASRAGTGIEMWQDDYDPDNYSTDNYNADPTLVYSNLVETIANVLLSYPNAKIKGLIFIQGEVQAGDYPDNHYPDGLKDPSSLNLITDKGNTQLKYEEAVVRFLTQLRTESVLGLNDLPVFITKLGRWADEDVQTVDCISEIYCESCEYSGLKTINECIEEIESLDEGKKTHVIETLGLSSRNKGFPYDENNDLGKELYFFSNNSMISLGKKVATSYIDNEVLTGGLTWSDYSKELQSHEPIDIYIIAGDANAAGRGWITGSERKQDTEAYTYDPITKKIIKSSLETVPEYGNCDNCPHYIGFNRYGVSARMTDEANFQNQGQNVAYGFVNQYRKFNPNTRIGFIQAAREKCGIEQWQSDFAANNYTATNSHELLDEDKTDLYQNLLDAVNTVMTSYPNATIKAMIFSHGEVHSNLISDYFNKDPGAITLYDGSQVSHKVTYDTAVVRFFKHLRTEENIPDDLPVMVAQAPKWTLMDKSNSFTSETLTSYFDLTVKPFEDLNSYINSIPDKDDVVNSKSLSHVVSTTGLGSRNTAYPKDPAIKQGELFYYSNSGVKGLGQRIAQKYYDDVESSDSHWCEANPNDLKCEIWKSVQDVDSEYSNATARANETIIIPHRGYWSKPFGDGPAENTGPAVDDALNIDSEYPEVQLIEIDLSPTSDNDFVLTHDLALHAQTDYLLNSARVDELGIVYNMTADEITSNYYMYKRNGNLSSEKLITLTDALKKLRDYNDAHPTTQKVFTLDLKTKYGWHPQGIYLIDEEFHLNGNKKAKELNMQNFDDIIKIAKSIKYRDGTDMLSSIAIKSNTRSWHDIVANTKTSINDLRKVYWIPVFFRFDVDPAKLDATKESIKNSIDNLIASFPAGQILYLEVIGSGFLSGLYEWSSVFPEYDGAIEYLIKKHKIRPGAWLPEINNPRGFKDIYGFIGLNKNKTWYWGDPLFLINPKIKGTKHLVITTDRPDVFFEMKKNMNEASNNSGNGN